MDVKVSEDGISRHLQIQVVLCRSVWNSGGDTRRFSPFGGTGRRPLNFPNVLRKLNAEVGVVYLAEGLWAVRCFKRRRSVIEST